MSDTATESTSVSVSTSVSASAGAGASASTGFSYEAVQRIVRDNVNSSVHDLSLSHKRIAVLPCDVGLLHNLVSLGLSHNLLSDLPLELARLHNLRYINLRSNCIEVFPAVLCLLPSLEALDLGKNRLKLLPPDFGLLMNLKVLSLSKNYLSQLPSYIGYMPDLKVLLIEQNPLVFPPPEITSGFTRPLPNSPDPNEPWLQSLKQYLRRTPPPPLPPRSMFSECDQLVDLYMSTKPISTVFLLDPADAQLNDTATSCLWIFSRLYRTIKPLNSIIPEKPIPLTLLNSKTINLVCAVVDFTPPSAFTESESEVSSKPDLSKYFVCDKTSWESFPPDVVVKKCVYEATVAAKAVVLALSAKLKRVVEKADKRVSRSLLVEWYSLNLEFTELLKSMVADNSNIIINGIDNNNINNINVPVKNEFGSGGGLKSVAESAVQAAESVVELLRGCRLSELKRKQLQGEVQSQEELESIVAQVEKATVKVKGSWEVVECNAFVKVVIKLSTLMRTLSSQFMLPEDIRAALPVLTRSTKELAKSLTTFR